LDVLSALKRRIKQIARPPKYRILEKPETQIERIVRRDMAPEPVRSIKLILHATDSVVADVNDSWIFKFPRREYCAAQLEKEARVLAYFGKRVSLAMPRMTIHSKGYFRSRHAKIPGEILTTEGYDRLTPDRREALAESLALFFAQMHATPLADAAALNLERRMPWKPAREIVADAEDLLPAHIHPYIRRTMERFDAANAEIVEEVVGHFDVHGENMAFDAGAGRLNGLFDFADAGIADYHKEIQATCWISPDLADRIIPRYEALTGRTVDRARVALFQEAGRIVNVAFSKGIRPEVAADFVRRYEADHLS